jgi:glycosyltransferase involved in cell wall biosynthesis
MANAARPLKILHVLRSPLGGLFRHVVDLVNGQIDRGHAVGIIADSQSQGPHSDALLGKLATLLPLGLSRVPMHRHLSPRDIAAVNHVGQRIHATHADVVHGHGAKGGAFARLATRGHPAIRVYTPHGGSVGTVNSAFYNLLERLLISRTDLLLFESAHIAELFRRKLGTPRAIMRVVHNGLAASEFTETTLDPAARDILFIGELRPVKGIDVLIDALSDLRRSGLALTATIVGDGGSRDALQAQAQRLGLSEAITFRQPLPARQAFPLGRLMIVPSRRESLPYIVLEAAAAGVPMIATKVGGIPEIFGPQAGLLIPPADPAALAQAIGHAVKNPETILRVAARLRDRVRANFSVDAMVDNAIAGYREALQQRELI